MHVKAESTAVRDEFVTRSADLMNDPNREVTVVLVNRYSTGDFFGVHVIGRERHAMNAWVKRTFGVNVVDVAGIRAVLDGYWPDSVQFDYDDLHEVAPETHRFIRDMVIPLEWKPFTDEQLAHHLTIIRKEA